jgi:hypothetical protein
VRDGRQTKEGTLMIKEKRLILNTNSSREGYIRKRDKMKCYLCIRTANRHKSFSPSYLKPQISIDWHSNSLKYKRKFLDGCTIKMKKHSIIFTL